MPKKKYQECMFCKYWHVNRKGDTIGTCRVNPPRDIPVNKSLLQAIFSRGIIYSGWPATNYNDWCAAFVEHKKEQKAV